MERLKYYMESLDKLHADTSEYMDDLKKKWNVTETLNAISVIHIQ